MLLVLEALRTCMLEELQKMREEVGEIGEKVDCLILDRLELHTEPFSVGTA